MSLSRSDSQPQMMVLEIKSPEDLMMLLQFLDAMDAMEKANKQAATAPRTPSSPMMFRSPSVSPVMSHDCGKEIEAPKPRGCGG